MTEMARYPLLTAEQEIALAKRYEQGRAAKRQLDRATDLGASEQRTLEQAVQRGVRARQRLIQCNLRLVISMAKRFRDLGMPFGDLVQEGNIGLMKAVDRYDHRRGNRLSTYASWWIEQSIRRALTNKGRIVRLPAYVNNALGHLRQASKKLESRLERRPTLPELATEMNLSLKEMRRLVRLQQRRIVSLDMPVGDEESSELADLIPDRDTPPVDEIYAQRELQQDVHDIVANTLSSREQKVLRLRFGLDGSQSRTLKQVADKLGVTRERVRQIEKRALRRLRHFQTRHGLGKTWPQL
jgi:RNA polymerase primary sigma factor